VPDRDDPTSPAEPVMTPPPAAGSALERLRQRAAESAAPEEPGDGTAPPPSAPPPVMPPPAIPSAVAPPVAAGVPAGVGAETVAAVPPPAANEPHRTGPVPAPPAFMPADSSAGLVRVPRPRNPRGLRVAGALLTLLVLAAIVGVVLAGISLHRRQQQDDARSGAAAAARQTLNDFNNQDFTKLDDWAARMQRDTDGSLQKEFAANLPVLKSIGAADKVVITGSAVVSTAQAQGDTATALVLTKIRRTSAAKPGGVPAINRWTVKLQRKGGTWKTVALDTVSPVAAK